MLRWMTVPAALCALAPAAGAQGNAITYGLLLRNGSQTWCGYTGPDQFQAAVLKEKPRESAIVTYSLGRPTQITHQVQAPSGDWTIVDRYTPAGSGFTLQRTDYLSTQNLQVVQSADVAHGVAGPLRIVGVTTPQGQKTAPPANLQLPGVPVITDMKRAPFMLVITAMRHESVPTLCTRVQ